MALIDHVEASVTPETTVDAAVAALLESIHKALVDAGDDPDARAAVLAALESEQDRILTAVTANTPAAPA